MLLVIKDRGPQSLTAIDNSCSNMKRAYKNFLSISYCILHLKIHLANDFYKRVESGPTDLRLEHYHCFRILKVFFQSSLDGKVRIFRNNIGCSCFKISKLERCLSNTTRFLAPPRFKCAMRFCPTRPTPPRRIILMIHRTLTQLVPLLAWRGCLRILISSNF